MVGLGFGMNLHQSLASGKEGMMFTIVSVAGTMLIGMLLNTYVLCDVPEVGRVVSSIARKVLTLTMFFIGASLSKSVLKSVGVRPLIQGVALWFLISVGSLLFILFS